MSAPRWLFDGQSQAACRGLSLDLFFGIDGERGKAAEQRTADAKKVCAGCPCKTACGEYALSRPGKYGTWGQMDEDERGKERRRRQRRGAA